MQARKHEGWVQLATRIPKHLLRRVKVQSVLMDISMTDFVVAALREKLGRRTKRAGTKR
jgi:hypothetical protein